jgi:hypothetical protein
MHRHPAASLLARTLVVWVACTSARAAPTPVTTSPPTTSATPAPGVQAPAAATPASPTPPPPHDDKTAPSVGDVVKTAPLGVALLATGAAIAAGAAVSSQLLDSLANEPVTKSAADKTRDQSFAEVGGFGTVAFASAGAALLIVGLGLVLHDAAVLPHDP